MGQNRPRHEAGDFELLPGGLAGVRRGAVADLLFGAFLALILVRAAHSVPELVRVAYWILLTCVSRPLPCRARGG